MPRSSAEDITALEGESWTDIEDVRRGPSQVLDDRRRLKAQLHQQLIAGMDLSVLGSISRDELRSEVRRMAEELSQRSSNLLNRAERERLVAEVLDETFGLGPLEPLMADPAISDILINGHNVVYVERNGRLERADVAFTDARHLLNIIQRIVGQVGRRVDETSPMVDGRLSDGSRINAIIPPLALDGALVSIRRFGVRPLLANDLVQKGALTEEMIAFLSACVRARLNILISGGTGSGKTRLLNALSAFIWRNRDIWQAQARIGRRPADSATPIRRRASPTPSSRRACSPHHARGARPFPRQRGRVSNRSCFAAARVSFGP